jgi:hypothetical protein
VSDPDVSPFSIQQSAFSNSFEELTMLTRRSFLHTTGSATAVAIAAFRGDGLSRIEAAGRRVENVAASDVATDESYWREIQQGFTLDRTIINLNNGGCSPSPRVVHDAFKRYLDISNQAPVYHMWQILEPNIESVRRRLAAEFGWRSPATRARRSRRRSSASI